MNPRTRSPVGPGSIDKVRMSAWGSPLSAATRLVKRSPRAVLYSRTYLACSVWSVVVFNRAWSLFHSACSRSASARLSFSNSDSTLRSPLSSSHHPSSAFGGVGVVVTVVVGVGGVGALGVRGVLGGAFLGGTGLPSRSVFSAVRVTSGASVRTASTTSFAAASASSGVFGAPRPRGGDDLSVGLIAGRDVRVPAGDAVGLPLDVRRQPLGHRPRPAGVGLGQLAHALLSIREGDPLLRPPLGQVGQGRVVG